MTTDLAVHQGGHDSESYLLTRPVSTPAPDRSKSVRDLLVNVTVGPGVPTLTAEAIQENKRRLKYPVLVSEYVVDGVTYRSYKEDRRIAGDGLRDALGTDRGEGTTESLDILRKEGAITVPGLLDKPPGRDGSGRFTKGKR